MRYLFLSVLSGIISGLVFWVPIVLFATFYHKKATGHYPLDLFGTGIDPKIPIFVGIFLALCHGFLIGLFIGLLKIRSVPRGILATIISTTLVVATIHLYSWFTTSRMSVYTNPIWAFLDNFMGAFMWFLVVAAFLTIPSAILASLCVTLSKYSEALLTAKPTLGAIN